MIEDAGGKKRVGAYQWTKRVGLGGMNVVGCKHGHELTGWVWLKVGCSRGGSPNK